MEIRRTSIPMRKFHRSYVRPRDIEVNHLSAAGFDMERPYSKVLQGSDYVYEQEAIEGDGASPIRRRPGA